MSQETKIFSPKKLIEVTLPLDDINAAAAREKSIRHGHPSTLHLWWARRPIAAARAVIFAQMVNDPGYQQGEGFKHGVNKKEAEIKREKLFQIIRDLVKWENTNNEGVLNRAREAIKESWRETCHLNRHHPQADDLFNPEKLPAFHDPFAGGGAIPLEAQRLGLESYASDLNPIATMINRAMIEIPPKFYGLAPSGPLPPNGSQPELLTDWTGSAGLAEDVRRYGNWMRDQAFSKIGVHFPKIEITEEIANDRDDLAGYVGETLTVIAWTWSRTVKSPSPAFSHFDVPLSKSFVLSTKKGKEAWLKPIINAGNYRFILQRGKPPVDAQKGTKVDSRGNFTCLLSGVPIKNDYIRDYSNKFGFGVRAMGIVCEGKKGRIYLAADELGLSRPQIPENLTAPSLALPNAPRYIAPPLYGMHNYEDLFTDRQLIALTTFSELVGEVRELARKNAIAAGLEDDGVSLEEGGKGAAAYGDAIAVYMSFAVDKGSNYWSTLCSWHSGRDTVTSTYGRQALPMVWDFTEANVFSNSSGNFLSGVSQAVLVLSRLSTGRLGRVYQQDASTQTLSENKVVSTDPPYYDNIGYADLSDFFYVWMRNSLRRFFPKNFSTIAVPKSEELIASPTRHGGKQQAEQFFLQGMSNAMQQISKSSHQAFPVTIYYAFRQSDTKAGKTSSTGWETFLEAVLQAGFGIVGTWPMKTEYTGNLKGSINALASSIILVCQNNTQKMPQISRREFQRELRDQMPDALEAMIGGETGATPIAPVDLAQAAIGPGMAIYSKYEAVLNQDGSKMSVHDALILINRTITDYQKPDSGNFDADTLFCDDWFSQNGWGEGLFGEANVLAQAKGTSVDGVQNAGVIRSGGGKVRLLKWVEYPNDWDPKSDSRVPVWEACHHMIRSLNEQGESGAGALLARMPEQGADIRQLAYHLYTLCERKKWADDARAYNELIRSWGAIVSASHETGHKGTQSELGLDF